MIDSLPLTNILFLDVETVSGCHHFEELSEEMQYLWSIKAAQLQRRSIEEIDAEELAKYYQDRAAIYAEFGKIVCISVGLIIDEGKNKLGVRLKSFQGYDESKILTDFAELLSQYFSNTSTHYMCGHNLREFDVPYICRRMIVHGIPLPNMLQLYLSLIHI